jgi:hypothetical protein
MANPTDLVSLAQAQNWGGAANVAFNAQLITSVSRQILTWLQRPSILPTTYTETIDSRGQSRFMLRNWPVLSVSALVVDHIAVPAARSPASTGVTQATFPNYGYLLSPWDGLPPGLPQWIDVDNFFWPWPYGRDDVSVTYRAGYQITAEPGIVSAVAPLQVNAIQPFGAWASDEGVTYADGTALTPVPVAPSAGQYSVAGGIYTFNVADADAAVLISYGYVPADLANAAAQWMAELVEYQQRIGLRSKSLGGQETMSWIVSPIPPMVQQALWPYRRVMG